MDEGVEDADDGTDVLAVLCCDRGTDNLAFTANRWSLLDAKVVTASSNLTFSCLNWYKQDSKEATEKKNLC